MLSQQHSCRISGVRFLGRNVVPSEGLGRLPPLHAFVSVSAWSALMAQQRGEVKFTWVVRVDAWYSRSTGYR